MRKIFLTLVLLAGLFGVSHRSSAQCIEIESILVDACGAQEGLNEMVRFKVGNAAVNTSNLSVDWPNNNWQGLLQNSTTAAKVAALNADIAAAGGCAQLIEPTGGVLPANATVILVSSHMMDTALNQFGAITQSMYIIFQNNPDVVSGHFANFGAGLRTLEISFGSCSDAVTYNRALLIDADGATTAGDGATVNFTPSGVASYVNFGCSAPVPPFSVDAGNAPASVCQGSTISLSGSAVGYQSVLWTASAGTFSNATSLNTNFTLPAGVTSPITITLTATNICNAQVSSVITITPTALQTPTFSLATTYCQGSAVPALPLVSQNGIAGSWMPSAISNTAAGTYLFTPNPGQCADSFTLETIITTSAVPVFTLENTVCSQSTPLVLPTTSNNGIQGEWNPSVISTTNSGSYVFTPTPGQCASPITHVVTVAPSVAPVFSFATTYCQGAPGVTLPTISDNGINGVWDPPAISTNASATYQFTPLVNSCASPLSVLVTITDLIAPEFSLTSTYCSGSATDALPTVSSNGIQGEWNPSVISNTASGSYVFTPSGSCASAYTLNVVITDAIMPDFETSVVVCADATPVELENISPNGISGSWLPAFLSGAGTYVFTPDAGQCAQTLTLTAVAAQADFTVGQTCQGTSAVLGVTANPGFEINSVSWTDAAGNTVATGEIFNVSEWLANQPSATFPLQFAAVVTGAQGCEFVEPVAVNAVWCGIPKGVSANGDQANDTFNLSGLGVSQLKIFNRYGQEVYSKPDYTNQWAGQSNDGKELPDATYYYVISTYSGEVKTGWVYLIKKA